MGTSSERTAHEDHRPKRSYSRCQQKEGLITELAATSVLSSDTHIEECEEFSLSPTPSKSDPLWPSNGWLVSNALMASRRTPVALRPRNARIARPNTIRADASPKGPNGSSSS
ncbi:unnamed protein product [Medioppia subpectinata]|uniref:Uncharacterized protein n=1 Tax=Medioppia subpectinata TaxID=1979941 RepID=A0A7R9KZF3_9ACAR|nr:unnamed protein product [Medioppia subpectinata]CAG2112749.1 unnamed protein product [Medioppia subpectinata]